MPTDPPPRDDLDDDAEDRARNRDGRLRRPVVDDRGASETTEHGRDDETAREGLELELMDEDASEAGEDIGQHND